MFESSFQGLHELKWPITLLHTVVVFNLKKRMSRGDGRLLERVAIVSSPSAVLCQLLGSL